MALMSRCLATKMWKVGDGVEVIVDSFLAHVRGERKLRSLGRRQRPSSSFNQRLTNSISRSLDISQYAHILELHLSIPFLILKAFNSFCGRSSRTCVGACALKAKHLASLCFLYMLYGGFLTSRSLHGVFRVRHCFALYRLSR